MGKVLASAGAAAEDGPGVPLAVLGWGATAAGYLAAAANDELDDLIVTSRRAYHLVRQLDGGPGSRCWSTCGWSGRGRTWPWPDARWPDVTGRGPAPVARHAGVECRSGSAGNPCSGGNLGRRRTPAWNGGGRRSRPAVTAPALPRRHQVAALPLPRRPDTAAGPDRRGPATAGGPGSRGGPAEPVAAA